MGEESPGLSFLEAFIWQSVVPDRSLADSPQL